MESSLSRRNFLQTTLTAGVGISIFNPFTAFASEKHSGMKLGLVTYQWAKDWDLPTLIANCTKTGYLGVELRTEHKHGVEIALSPIQREEVKKRFADSPVKCLGYGSNFEYHSTDPITLKKNIDQTKEYIKLCKDIGATGIKVKPNNLPAITGNWFGLKFMAT